MDAKRRGIWERIGEIIHGCGDLGIVSVFRDCPVQRREESYRRRILAMHYKKGES